jgi:hypothetical protein
MAEQRAPRTPRAGTQDPEEWRGDLSPNALEGRNEGAPRWEDAGAYVTAYDVKEVHDRLHRFTDDDLKRIPLVPGGARLEQGATYFDLLAAHPEPFSARGDQTAERGNAYVAKSEVDYQLWNLLVDALASAPEPGAREVKEQRRQT